MAASLKADTIVSDIKPSILLIDDKPERLLSYVAILESLDIDLVEAKSGLDALRHIDRMDFAAILLDVNMPGLNGFETAARIRGHARGANTPIIFVTGIHVTDLDRIRGYSMGASDYVFVPVVPEILRAKVRVLVQLYRQKQELSLLNQKLVETNEELARAHAELRAENMRELKKLNETLASTNSRLKTEVRERRKAEQRLTDAAQRKDQFISVLAHELRNPLSAIHSAIELIRGRLPDDRDIQWAGSIVKRQLGHLVRLIDDLLDVSRVTSGRVQIKPQVIDIRQVLEDSLDAVRPQIEARRHEVRIGMPDGPVYIDGDGVRLEQVFGNLLTNAAKYMAEGGLIEIEAHPIAEGVPRIAIHVRDHGIGLQADALEHIFELFAQAEAPVDGRHDGLGIGLALVRGLVELHGGTVRAESDGRQRGSKFIVELPLCERSPEVADPVRETVRSGPLRLLIVDDNVDAAQGLAKLFGAYSAHEVRITHDGATGLRAATEFRPDVMLLDIGLPDIDGYEVARRVRARRDLDAVSIIAITGFGVSPEHRDGWKDRFDHFLTKPVSLPDLERVLAHCERSRRMSDRARRWESTSAQSSGALLSPSGIQG
jgi:signal transduction histidine kinase